jgi:hypothetical protein
MDLLKREILKTEKSVLAFEKHYEGSLNLVQWHMSEFYEKQLKRNWMHSQGSDYLLDKDRLTLLTKSAKLFIQNGEISCREGKGIQSAIKIGPN